MNKSIYNIEKEYLTLAEELSENSGEVTPELETALAINKEELEVKSANYGYVVKSIEDNIQSIDNEIERLTQLKNASNKVIERLKTNVANAMEMYGIEEIKCNNIKINFRKSKSVVIENEALIPDFYKEKKTTTSISKTAISNGIKNGLNVPGAYLQENKKLQIK